MANKNMTLRIHKYLFFLFIFWPFYGVFAHAQSYPTKPVRAIVPYPPGGGTDIMARAVSTKLSEMWRVQVVVDNRGGGGTIIGTEIAARSPADGYTLLITSTSFVINPTTRSKLPYDTEKDFAPVTQFAFQPYVLVVHPKVPARDVKEFIALAKAKPEFLNFGSTGVGSGSHLAGELFKFMTSANLTHVAYKGMGPAITDLLGAQTQFIFATILPVAQHVRSGRLRALGVSSEKRSAIMPDLPTIAEAGVPGYATVSWSGLFVPAGTPRAIIEKLNIDVVKIIQQTDTRERFAGDGAEPAGTSIKEFEAFVRGEITKWAKVIRAAKISIN
jgi:tripartite-type tricarboxylate transporter receptor subunit TctC